MKGLNAAWYIIGIIKGSEILQIRTTWSQGDIAKLSKWLLCIPVMIWTLFILWKDYTIKLNQWSQILRINETKICNLHEKKF